MAGVQNEDLHRIFAIKQVEERYLENQLAVKISRYFAQEVLNRKNTQREQQNLCATMPNNQQLGLLTKQHPKPELEPIKHPDNFEKYAIWLVF